LAVQTDLFAALPSVVVCPLMTHLRTDADLFRLDVSPSAGNGPREASQITVDKDHHPAGSEGRGGDRGGDDGLMLRVAPALALFLGVM